MVDTTKRTQEKGQRTPRSMDVYQEGGGIKGAAVCRCGAIFHNKRWQRGHGDVPPAEARIIVCPACRRINDNNPAGIVSLRGSYFAANEAGISNLVNNTEQSATMKNPLGRVMETRKEGDGITITTTDSKLAQKIGREVYKSHGGELHFQWDQAGDLVRVSWSR